MGQNMNYLFDTNILIYYFNGSLVSKAKADISAMLKENFNISVILKWNSWVLIGLMQNKKVRPHNFYLLQM